MDIIKADTQYGDMKGTISLDGWSGLSSLTVFGGRKGYWPVGVQISGEPPAQGADLAPTVYLLLVDEELLGEGHPAEGVRRYVKEHGHIPVFRYEISADARKLLPQIKRLSVVLADKCTEGAPLVLAGEDEIYCDPETDE